MKQIMKLFAIVFILMAFTVTAFASVQSLRGKNDLNKPSNKAPKHKIEVVSGGIERNFKKQPPVIPHKTEKYHISLRNNGCLKCHSPKAYKKEKAPKVGDSHFIDRSGKKLNKVSKRRYFCTQCHVTQVQEDALVDNTYTNE